MKKILTILLTITILSSCSKERKAQKQLEADVIATKALALTLSTGSVYIPNIFTPNGDGINDSMIVYKQNIDSLWLSINNSKGEPVLNIFDHSGGVRMSAWGGTPHSGYSAYKIVEEVYSYTITGETSSAEKFNTTGNVVTITHPENYCFRDDTDSFFPNQFNGLSFDKAINHLEKDNCR